MTLFHAEREVLLCTEVAYLSGFAVTHWSSMYVVQMKDLRGGPLSKQFAGVQIVEASVVALDSAEAAAAERALLGVASRLEPVVKLTSAH
jgi:hypothetical protein